MPKAKRVKMISHPYTKLPGSQEPGLISYEEVSQKACKQSQLERVGARHPGVARWEKNREGRAHIIRDLLWIAVHS